MVPKFTEFYLPVLQVLSNIEKREVNALIEEVATHMALSDEDRKIPTRGGTRPRYQSNILWAITDLCQGGFIERANRGHYVINIEGLTMLEENPSHPDRDYLSRKSEKFRTFIEKKGTRPRKPMDEEGSLFDDEYSQPQIEDSNSEVVDEDKTIVERLELLKLLLPKMKEAGLPTTDAETQIKELEAKLSNSKVMALINRNLLPVLIQIGQPLSISIDFNPNIDATVRISPLHDTTKAFVSINYLSTPGEEEELPELEPKPRTRSDNKGLVVTLPNGKVLKDAPAVEIFEYIVRYVGPEKVEKIGIRSAGMPLVSKVKPQRYTYRELNNGYYLTTNNSTPYKKMFIEKIAEVYGLEIKVEVID